MKQKKKYIKPVMETYNYAKFENVFTACNKGNEHQQHCQSNTAPHESAGSWSAHFANNGSM